MTATAFIPLVNLQKKGNGVTSVTPFFENNCFQVF